MVVSPRNSINSLPAFGLDARNRSTTTLVFWLLFSVTVPEFPRCADYLCLVPVERALFPEINIPDQKDGDVNEHLYEAIDSEAVRYLEHVPINVRPGDKEDRFYIEQDQHHTHNEDPPE